LEFFFIELPQRGGSLTGQSHSFLVWPTFWLNLYRIDIPTLSALQFDLSQQATTFKHEVSTRTTVLNEFLAIISLGGIVHVSNLK